MARTKSDKCSHGDCLETKEGIDKINLRLYEDDFVSVLVHQGLQGDAVQLAAITGVWCVSNK